MKLYLTIFILTFTSYVSGQINKRINLHSYDDRQVHYGFLLGLNYGTFKINPSVKFVEQSDTTLPTNFYALGGNAFNLGFVINYRLGDFFDFRLLPQVSFYDIRISYKFRTDNDEILEFRSPIVELPILLKYKSQRRGNTRLYMVTGVKSSFELGAKKRQENNQTVGLKPFGLSLEYGIGLDIYYPLFKLAPELRFSLGLIDVFKPSERKNIFSEPIDKITPYTVTLAFLFE